MNTELIMAVAAAVTAIGGVIGSILSYSRAKALLEYRLKQVEEKLDAHNHYAEKLGDISIAVAKIQKDIEYLRGNKE